jgi:plasmid stabilization system protein ParE
MALEIYWTKRASKTFDKIQEYLIEEWGENVTRAFVRKVFDTLDILSEFPEVGTIENEEKAIRGFTIVKQVNMFYRISGQRIILLMFFDNRQHPKKKRF